MGNRSTKYPKLWPFGLILTNEDFDILRSIVDVLTLVKLAAKEMMLLSSPIVDLIPTFSSVLDQVCSIFSPVPVAQLKICFLDSFSARL